MLHLNPQQRAIYDYLAQHGEATIVELRNALFIAKPCMRCSEINLMYKKEHGKPLIITIRKKPNGEHVKGLAERLKKPKSTFTYNPISGKMEEEITLINV